MYCSVTKSAIEEYGLTDWTEDWARWRWSGASNVPVSTRPPPSSMVDDFLKHINALTSWWARRRARITVLSRRLRRYRRSRVNGWRRRRRWRGLSPANSFVARWPWSSAAYIARTVMIDVLLMMVARGDGGLEKYGWDDEDYTEEASMEKFDAMWQQYQA